jgi:hypothetical protein
MCASLGHQAAIAWAALALERGFPAITLDVHLQDRGMVRSMVLARQDRTIKVFPREPQAPAALGALVKAGADKWRPIVKELGIKAE